MLETQTKCKSIGVIMENDEPQEKKAKLGVDGSNELFDRKIELNQQTTNDNSQLDIVNRNDNQEASIDAIEPNGEPKTAIFKLDADFWDEIFDCLSYDDVISIGQPCTVFEGVAGKYLQWQYAGLIH